MTQPPSSFLPGAQPMPPTSQGHCGYKMEQNRSVGTQERTSESTPWALLVLVPGLESRLGPPSCSPHLSGAANGYSTATSRRVLRHAFPDTFLIQSPEHGMDSVRYWPPYILVPAAGPALNTCPKPRPPAVQLQEQARLPASVIRVDF